MIFLFFTASVNIGGIERVFLSYAAGLMSQGHSVHYVSCREKGELGLDLPDNLQFHNLGNVRLRYSVFKLRRLLLEIKPNIIITGNDSTLVAYLSKILTFKRDFRIVTSQHSYYKNNETLFYTKYILKYFFPRCNKVIAVSNGIADMLANDFNMREPFVKVINNPIDIQKIDKDSFKKVSDVQLPENYVTFIGRMTPVKNLYFLIDSFELFWVRHCDYFLLMIGEGYQRNELEEYLSRKKCANNVLFIGAQENPYSFLNDAKLLLLTSYSEAYPTVLIEAMSLGVTCVCTPTLGAKDILEEGKYGYIINTFDDKMEYFQAMESALSNPLEKKMLRNLVEQKYSLDKKINDFLNFVNS